MGSQEQYHGGGGNREDEEYGEVGSGQERREQLRSDTDEILDEIDGVLEANAEEFVSQYIQKGGQ